MSVAERLRAFRYVTSARDVPWTYLRSVDVATHRVSDPDLHLLKNLISLVADCSLAGAAAPSVSAGDIAQLLGTLQLSLQFALWSQSVLKEQLAERQNSAAAQHVHSHYVEGLEAKLEAARTDAAKVREERDALRATCRGLERRLTQAETTARLLEKDLSFERRRLAEVLQRPEPEAQRALSPPRRPPRPQAAKPKHRREQEESEEEEEEEEEEREKRGKRRTTRQRNAYHYKQKTQRRWRQRRASSVDSDSSFASSTFSQCSPTASPKAPRHRHKGSQRDSLTSLLRLLVMQQSEQCRVQSQQILQQQPQQQEPKKKNTQGSTVIERPPDETHCTHCRPNVAEPERVMDTQLI